MTMTLLLWYESTMYRLIHMAKESSVQQLTCENCCHYYRPLVLTMIWIDRISNAVVPCSA